MTRIIIASIFLLVFTSCNMTSDTQNLRADIQADTILILKKISKQGNIWGIDIKINGDFDDTITLIHTNGKNVAYHYKLIGGIDTTYHTDWYSDSCLVKFENIKEPIKDLQIEYEFFD
ncbi:hypothetical protein [Marinifilum caeruleilacunae]|uniref:Lipoprotein n=1 Tax=Marinifilum caeruleilacunae TaxID=2499076 RepID=A0ABX1X256_9BACT|nr:hypothetical protein [Marinifilum caeruleilacunae]NOU62331.1 hypothetical protein [Marinifilum caeruleilacunae]